MSATGSIIRNRIDSPHGTTANELLGRLVAPRLSADEDDVDEFDDDDFDDEFDDDFEEDFDDEFDDDLDEDDDEDDESDVAPQDEGGE